MDLIKFEDFAKLDIRVVTIVGATVIPKSDKLLLLEVDDGTADKRQIVAGIKKHFPQPEVLIGTQITAVLNLEPRKVMGITSHGMILAASSEDNLQIVSPRNFIKPGSKVG